MVAFLQGTTPPFFWGTTSSASNPAAQIEAASCYFPVHQWLPQGWTEESDWTDLHILFPRPCWLVWKKAHDPHATIMFLKDCSIYPPQLAVRKAGQHVNLWFSGRQKPNASRAWEPESTRVLKSLGSIACSYPCSPWCPFMPLLPNYLIFILSFAIRRILNNIPLKHIYVHICIYKKGKLSISYSIFTVTGEPINYHNTLQVI